MKAKRIIEAGIWVLWIVVGYLTFRAHNTKDYHLKHELRKKISFLLPQGWGFFTRDPREAVVKAYRILNGETEELTVQNSSAANYLGFSRNSRYTGIELSRVLETISQHTWKNGKGDFRNNLLSKPDTVVVLKEKLRFFPAGEYLLHQYKPIPFTWASKDQERHQPYLSVKIKILHQGS